jgi:hypothetical protein
VCVCIWMCIRVFLCSRNVCMLCVGSSVLPNDTGPGCDNTDSRHETGSVQSSDSEFY